MWQQIQKERVLMQRLQLNFPRDYTPQKPRTRQNKMELAQQTVTSHHITSQLEPLMESVFSGCWEENNELKGSSELEA